MKKSIVNLKKNKDKFLFNVKTIIDKKEFKKFHKFYTNKYKKDYFFKVVILILAVIALILNFIKGNYYVVILLLMSGFIYPFILYVSLEKQLDKLYSKYKKINAIEEELCFFNEYFCSKTRLNVCEVRYDEVDIIYETKENIYIFISDTKAFILIKNNINNIDDFINFIKNKTNYRRIKEYF